MLYSFSARGKQGLIDVRGKVVVRATYDTTGSAGDEFAYGRKHNEWIYLDAKGTKLFSRQPPYVVEFGSDGLGATLRYVATSESLRAALIHPSGKEIAVDADDIWPPSDGLAVARAHRGASTPIAEHWWNDTGTNRFGYVDLRGAWKIRATFAGAGPFLDGVAPAAMKPGSWGAIDRAGSWIVKPAYARTHAAGEGTIATEKAGRFGLVGPTGKVIANPQFMAPPRFHDGWSGARIPGGAGAIDTSGRWVIEPTWSDAGQPIGDVIPLARDSRWGLVARDGRVILKPTYASIARHGDLFLWSSIYYRTKPQKWGYLTPDGEELWSGTR